MSYHAISLPPVIANFRCMQLVNPTVIIVVWSNQFSMLAIYRGIIKGIRATTFYIQ